MPVELRGVNELDGIDADRREATASLSLSAR